MNVLVVDAEEARRGMIADALASHVDDYRLFEAASLEEMRGSLRLCEFRMIIIGTVASGSLPEALAGLREHLPDCSLLAGTRISPAGVDVAALLLDSGADMVFDLRLTGLALSRALRPYLRSWCEEFRGRLGNASLAQAPPALSLL